MFNMAAAFGGGMLIRQTWDEMKLPRLKRANETSGFRLSVRVVAASAPALSKPGWLSGQRPALEVSVGDVHKETELGDYEEGGSSSREVSKDCPWRFGDVLTFKLSMQELQGPGLKLKLRAVSDLMLGPLQLQMARRQDVGEACLDLRRRALPFCGRKGEEVWESPVLLVPLSHVRGGIFADAQLGEAVATVAVSFSVDTDPETILAAVEAPSFQQVSANLAERAGEVMRQVYDIPTPLGWFNFEAKEKEEAVNGLRTLTPGETLQAAERAGRRGEVLVSSGEVLQAPDLHPEGWICRKGPHGRYHWHHRSLGLAPWEEEDMPRSSTGKKSKGPSLPRVREDSPVRFPE